MQIGHGAYMRKQTIRGFALIDTLVAMNMVATAMLITLTGYAHSRYAAQQQLYKNVAIRQASEFAAWMVQINDLAMDSVTGQARVQDLLREVLRSNDASDYVSCFYTECSLAQQLAFDFYIWRQRLQQTVPGVRIQVCRDDQPWDKQSSSWRWTCAEEGALKAPYVIKIGWPQTASAITFHPNLVFTIGPIAS